MSGSDPVHRSGEVPPRVAEAAKTSDTRLRAAPSSPVVRQRLPSTVGETELARFLAQLDDLFTRQQPWAMVLELDDAIVMPAGIRRKLGAELEARRGALETKCVALAFVARTSSAQGVHTALRWVVRPACAERVFIAYEPADAWVRSHLPRPAEEK